jgi:hypothetical protein
MRNDNTGEQTTMTSTSTELSIQDSPGHAMFILNKNSPYDWRTPSNDNLWQGVNGTNNPCPEGWRIPTSEEFAAEGISSIEDGYTKLKLTLGGTRSGEFGHIVAIGADAYYWTSTLVDNDHSSARFVDYGEGYGFESSTIRASGASCRCIKD